MKERTTIREREVGVGRSISRIWSGMKERGALVALTTNLRARAETEHLKKICLISSLPTPQQGQRAILPSNIRTKVGRALKIILSKVPVPFRDNFLVGIENLVNNEMRIGRGVVRRGDGVDFS